VDWSLAVDLESAVAWTERVRTTLGPQRYVKFDGDPVGGSLTRPAVLRSDALLVQTSLVGRAGGNFFGLFRAEVTLGFRVDVVDVEVRDDRGQRADRRHWNGGPQLGMRYGLRPLNCLELYGALSGAWLLDSYSGTFQAEAGVVFTPIRHVGLFGAYRYLDWKQDGRSAVQLEFTGPVAGLLLEF
jgi:hypothetical protein